ncbi:MAG: AAA family ATPase [Patescibacteria group bacterium]
MESFKIFLGGINSSGKTSLLDALVFNNCGVDVCYGSKEFINWLGLKQGDYESLEQLQDDYKNQELSKMVQFLINQINNNINHDKWIFSGHLGRIKETNIVSAIGNWISNFNLIVLLTAEPEILINRIKHDFAFGIRKRDKLMELIDLSKDPIEIFSEFVKQTEKIAEQIASIYEIPLLKLNSSEFDPSQLSIKLLNYIRISE